MVLLASTYPEIDLSLGSLPVYLFLFVFIWAGVLFVRRVIKDKNPKAHLWSLSLAGLGLLATLLYAILTDSLHLFTQPFSWWIIIGFLILAFLIQSFKRVFGTLTSVILTGFIIMVILFIRSLTAFTGRSLIAQIEVRELSKTNMNLLITPQPAAIPGITEPFTQKLPGQSFGVIVSQVIFDDTAIFLGAKTRYSWLGLMSFDKYFKQESVELFEGFESRKELFDSLENRELSLPFVRSVQTDIAVKLALPQKKYQVWIENDGGVTISALK